MELLLLADYLRMHHLIMTMRSQSRLLMLVQQSLLLLRLLLLLQVKRLPQVQCCAVSWRSHARGLGGVIDQPLPLQMLPISLQACSGHEQMLSV